MMTTSEADNPFRPPMVVDSVAAAEAVQLFRGLSLRQRFFGWLVLVAAAVLLAGYFLTIACVWTFMFMESGRPPISSPVRFQYALLLICAASSSTLVVAICRKRQLLSIVTGLMCFGAFSLFILNFVAN